MVPKGLFGTNVMSDPRKRILVTLSDETYEAIVVVAELSGVSKSRYLSELIEGGPAPAIQEIAQAFRAFSGLHEDRIEDIEAATAEAHDAVRRAVSVLLQRPGDPPVLTGGLATSQTGPEDAV